MVEVDKRRWAEGKNAGAAPQVLLVAGSARGGKTYRVNTPDRVLRVWGLLSEAREELDFNSMPAEGRARLQRMLEAATVELQRSVSPLLADELRPLILWGEPEPGAGELRIEYASVLGWVSGLVVGILGQVAALSEEPAAEPHRAKRGQAAPVCRPASDPSSRTAAGEGVMTVGLAVPGEGIPWAPGQVLPIRKTGPAA